MRALFVCSFLRGGLPADIPAAASLELNKVIVDLGWANEAGKAGKRQRGATVEAFSGMVNLFFPLLSKIRAHHCFLVYAEYLRISNGRWRTRSLVEPSLAQAV